MTRSIRTMRLLQTMTCAVCVLVMTALAPSPEITRANGLLQRAETNLQSVAASLNGRTSPPRGSAGKLLAQRLQQALSDLTPAKELIDKTPAGSEGRDEAVARYEAAASEYNRLNGIMTGGAAPTTHAPAGKAKPKAATPRTKAKDATRATVAAQEANPAKPGKPPKTPHVSALSAAVLVLASAPAEGMTTKAMIEAMVEQKLWASPKGKTPEASLYAAITREIGKKGAAARFKKVDRGHFVLTNGVV